MRFTCTSVEKQIYYNLKPTNENQTEICKKKKNTCTCRLSQLLSYPIENFPLKIHVYKKLEQLEIEENALLLFRY